MITFKKVSTKVLGSFFLVAVVFSCKTHVSPEHVKYDKAQNQNYIPYYLTVNKAVDLYKNNEEQKSFYLLDSLFTIYTPLNTLSTDELELYCELAVKNNKTDRLSEFVSILVSEYGYDLASNQDSLWTIIKSKSNYTNSDLELKYETFLTGINRTLRDTIVRMFEVDQEVRKTRNSIKIDSIDRINELKTVYVIEKYGYPSIKLIGGHGKDDNLSPATLSVLLKHISYQNLKQILPILLNEVKAGKCPPFVYASMLDVRKIIAKEQTDYEYFGTIKNVKPTDTVATNLARETIGLPKIKY